MPYLVGLSSIKWARRYVADVAVATAIGALIPFFLVGYGLLFNYLSSYVMDHLHPLQAILSSIALLMISYYLIRLSSYGNGGALEIFLETYHFRGGYARFKDLILLLIATLATVAAGGSVGVAGVAVLTGYVVARKLADYVKQVRSRRFFPIVGAAAGISAVFKAPLTAMAFSLEIPFKHGVEATYLLPALASSVTAFVVSKAVFGGQEILMFIKPTSPLQPEVALHSAVIGALAAGLTYIAYYVKLWLKGLSKLMSRLGRYEFVMKPLIGGLAVAITYYLITPYATGSGFNVIPKVLSIKSANLLTGLTISKLLLMVVILEMGGAGGVFVPLVVAGAALGAAYGRALGLPYVDLLMMAGIAGLFSSANKVLLTSVLLAAEAGGLVATVPAGIATAVAYALTALTSIHFLQPAVGHGRFRARASRLLLTICSEGVDTLKSLVIKDYVEPACSVDPNSRVSEVLSTCEGLRYVICGLGGGNYGYVRVATLTEYLSYDPRIKDVVDRAVKLRADESLSNAVEELVYGGSEVAVVVNEGGSVVGVISIEGAEEVVREVVTKVCLRR